jgi:hypothetical protein
MTELKRNPSKRYPLGKGSFTMGKGDVNVRVRVLKSFGYTAEFTPERVKGLAGEVYTAEVTDRAGKPAGRRWIRKLPGQRWECLKERPTS